MLEKLAPQDGPSATIEEACVSECVYALSGKFISGNVCTVDSTQIRQNFSSTVKPL